MPPKLPKLPLLSTLKTKYASNPLALFTSTLKTLLLAHVITTYAYTVTPTLGASMLPTFSVLGDSVLISQYYRRGRGVVVGDVSFDSVVEPGERVIKRVLGLEGDYVLRNTPGSTRENDTIQVPKGHCWVVGDNLPYSRDSRHFGPMPLALIRGKVIAKVFPWRERGWIRNGLDSVPSIS